MKPHLYQGWYERLNDQEINKMKPHLYQGPYEQLNDQEINKWNPTSIRASMND